MYVIGITGPIGHGKTTFAKALLECEQASRHLASFTIIANVANYWLRGMPESLAGNPPGLELLNYWIEDLAEIINREKLARIKPKLLLVSQEQLDHRDKDIEKLLIYLEDIRYGGVNPHDIITPDNKEQHRALLQWLGGYLVKKAKRGIWFEEIERQIKQTANDGCRLCVVDGLRFVDDGEIIKRNNGIIARLIRPSKLIRDTDDPTETERQHIQVDTNVVNDSDTAALKETARLLLEDYRKGALLKEYISSESI